MKSVIPLKKKVHHQKFQICFTNSWDCITEKGRGMYVSMIDTLSMLKLLVKKKKKNFPDLKKKHQRRVSWIKFNSEVALYFTRKINQMMQDIHISFIPLTVLPLGLL